MNIFSIFKELCVIFTQIYKNFSCLLFASGTEITTAFS